jgi:hypothetical protein
MEIKCGENLLGKRIILYKSGERGNVARRIAV